MNTWVSFQLAEQPLLGQFSVSGNILLTDDHALFRSSMVLMLEMRLPQKTVNEASTLDDVLTQDASLGSFLNPGVPRRALQHFPRASPLVRPVVADAEQRLFPDS
ncbi:MULTISPECIES: hypothetical protein [Pseudomonas syringae group]|uniref:hypothetical protein n=1 Tax=Pseudomonas syringae group TaxID=136849 RepID=UPI00155D8BC3|nr:hypothetical protein [Pseudomonas coronafaciens]